jgi:hypothetical protein
MLFFAVVNRAVLAFKDMIDEECMNTATCVV